MGSLGGWEIVIIIGVLVLLFGAKKLPDMARSVGQSARVFKGEMKGMKSDDEARDAGAAPQTPPAALPPTPPAAAPQAENPAPSSTQGRPDSTN
ncbi:Sec-independent protein translocase protein tatA/E-like protein [Pseudonocardia dioxanivorans CB1190]|uniref:Sec-independent protein translocase protein TatA n=1 Tax=Pseudonocardia dioxanivorans (strain ATCC 55486 / DSM 44775 / JCM 13855 / CB1190) TaxID=675635 RepID=F4CVZ2_PSEUX|nr:Sec-independent protein translocase subunit TatA [Pseudonocardia dioxanivorans]AEA25477.1 Sec-independent protein translocase protein tatA/E-like protein [Pseudonocardia dioxanivorans CB1190]